MASWKCCKWAKIHELSGFAALCGPRCNVDPFHCFSGLPRNIFVWTPKKDSFESLSNSFFPSPLNRPFPSIFHAKSTRWSCFQCFGGQREWYGCDPSNIRGPHRCRLLWLGLTGRGGECQLGPWTWLELGFIPYYCVQVTPSCWKGSLFQWCFSQKTQFSKDKIRLWNRGLEELDKMDQGKVCSPENLACHILWRKLPLTCGCVEVRLSHVQLLPCVVGWQATTPVPAPSGLSRASKWLGCFSFWTWGCCKSKDASQTQ